METSKAEVVEIPGKGGATQAAAVVEMANISKTDRDRRNLLKLAYDLEDNCEELLNGFFTQKKAIIRVQVKAGVLEQEAEEIMLDLEEIRRKMLEQQHKLANIELRVRKRLLGGNSSEASSVL